LERGGRERGAHRVFVAGRPCPQSPLPRCWADCAKAIELQEAEEEGGGLRGGWALEVHCHTFGCLSQRLKQLSVEWDPKQEYKRRGGGSGERGGGGGGHQPRGGMPIKLRAKNGAIVAGMLGRMHSLKPNKEKGVRYPDRDAVAAHFEGQTCGHRRQHVGQGVLIQPRKGV